MKARAKPRTRILESESSSMSKPMRMTMTSRAMMKSVKSREAKSSSTTSLKSWQEGTIKLRNSKKSKGKPRVATMMTWPRKRTKMTMTKSMRAKGTASHLSTILASGRSE